MTTVSQANAAVAAARQALANATAYRLALEAQLRQQQAADVSYWAAQIAGNTISNLSHGAEPNIGSSAVVATPYATPSVTRILQLQQMIAAAQLVEQQAAAALEKLTR